MLEILYPWEYAPSVFVIDYGKIFAKGYRAIIFDIDMTLVPHGYDATPKIEKLFETVHAVGLKTILLTNNDEKRVKSFIKNIDTEYVCDAEKPNRDGYLKALEILRVTKDKAIYIGDQIFTDIYGANKVGIANILVKYVTAHEEKNIGIRR
ncbi:MAG: HAD-IIIA family hydrolase, partial [Selenomonadaceae bacterium]|nr:HAD-IIIA family hydrolase [Selenomonadaceae bacterium]